MTETQFQQTVIELAQVMGWRVAHFRKAQNARGHWRTPVAADGAGFPDLVMLRGRRLVIAELKLKGKYPTIEQRKWLAAWALTGAEVHVWRPDDWKAIEACLTRTPF